MSTDLSQALELARRRRLRLQDEKERIKRDVTKTREHYLHSVKQRYQELESTINHVEGQIHSGEAILSKLREKGDVLTKGLEVLSKYERVTKYKEVCEKAGSTCEKVSQAIKNAERYIRVAEEGSAPTKSAPEKDDHPLSPHRHGNVESLTSCHQSCREALEGINVLVR